MHCCNINKGRRGDFILVHLVYQTRSSGTVHTSAKARLTSAAILKFNQLFIGPFPTLPENLMQIRSEVFSERELTFTFAICCRPSVCRLSVVCR